MKFKIDRRQVPGTYTRDGKSVPVTRTQEVRMPVLPRDWQTIALRTAVGIVLGLTLGSIVWSTVSIADLLGGGLVAYVAAGIFDLGWLTALLLAYLARYDEAKRGFPERLGWVLLVVTMVAIAWHGISKDNYGMAIIGAFVSFFAKVLWIAVMKHVNAQLTDEDKQWLAAEISDAQTKAAIATMRRQTARTEQRAALELLAMEKERREISEAFGLDELETKEDTPAIEAPSLADMGKADAIRFVHGRMPELSHTEIAELLAGYEVETSPDYVKQVLNRKPKTEPEPEEAPEAEIIELRK